MTRLFGTDGIRGVANVDLRPSLAFALGRATAHQVVGAGRLAGRGAGHPAFGRHVRGRDHRRRDEHGRRRPLGRDRAHAGARVPRRATAEFAAGIMVSASHNPAEDNGLKVLDPRGLKLDDDVEDDLEAAVLRADELPSVSPDAIGRTVEACGAPRLATSPTALALARDRRRVAACTSCSTRPTGRRTGWRPTSSRATGARVTVIHDAPDGDNINRGRGATAPASLADAVRAAGADVGFALDGDADRCVAVDSGGNLVDGDQVLGILALERLARGRPRPRQPRRVRPVQRRAPGGGRGGGWPDRPDPRRRQAHPRRDAGLGRRPRRREERPRDHPRAHHVGRRDRHRGRAAAGHDGGVRRDRRARDRGAAPAPAAARDPRPPPRPVGGRRRPRALDRRRRAPPRAARRASSCVPRAPNPSCG